MARRIRAHGGGVRVRISDEERQLLEQITTDYRELLLGGTNDITRRLYPTAYLDDPEANAAFVSKSHDALLARRLDNLDIVEQTINLEQLRIDQAEVWVSIINDMRLVLGTALDVSEDDEELDDLDEQTYASHAVYSHLGYLVSELLEALGG